MHVDQCTGAQPGLGKGPTPAEAGFLTRGCPLLGGSEDRPAQPRAAPLGTPAALAAGLNAEPDSSPERTFLVHVVSRRGGMSPAPSPGRGMRWGPLPGLQGRLSLWPPNQWGSTVPLGRPPRGDRARPLGQVLGSGLGHL